MLLGSATLGLGQTDATTELRKELDALRGDYEKRINQLEARIRELETQPADPKPEPKSKLPRQSRKEKSTTADDGGNSPKRSPDRKAGDTDPEPTQKNEELQAREFERNQEESRGRSIQRRNGNP